MPRYIWNLVEVASLALIGYVPAATDEVLSFFLQTDVWFLACILRYRDAHRAAPTRATPRGFTNAGTPHARLCVVDLRVQSIVGCIVVQVRGPGARALLF